VRRVGFFPSLLYHTKVTDTPLQRSIVKYNCSSATSSGGSMGFVSTVGGRGRGKEGRGREIDYSEMGCVVCKLRIDVTFMFTRKENYLAWMDTS